MERKGRFLAEFLGLSAVLGILWKFLSGFYVYVPVALAESFLKLSGAGDVRLGVGHHVVSLSGDLGGVSVPVLDLTVNCVFFLALSLAARDRIRTLTLLKLLGVGLAVLLAVQVLALVLAGLAFGHQAAVAAVVARFLGGLASFFLPVLLWMLLFYLPYKTSSSKALA